MNGRRKKKTWRRTLFICCGLFFPIFNFILFYIVPNGSAFFMAFQDKNGSWGFENFTRFAREFSSGDSALRLALKNTLLTFAILLVSYPFKVLVSYFIYKKIPFAGVYRILFFLPTIIFSVATAMVFQQLIAPSGFLAEWVRDVAGLEHTPELLADSRFANYTIWAQMLWLGFPGDLIIWGGTFARIPQDVLESGQLDGVNWFTEFTKIIVPMVWPTVSLNMVLMFCGILGAGGSVFLLTGGEYGTVTIPCWLYLQMYNFAGDSYTTNVYNYMSAVGLIITVISVALGTTIRKFTDKAFTEVELIVSNDL